MVKSTARLPSAAGQFYPASSSMLERQLGSLIEKQAKRELCLGVISPHAGYIYSGPVAGKLFSRIKLGSSFVIIGPNHTGHGKPFSIMASGSWQMPLGTVDIDEKLAKDLLAGSKYLQEDPLAHTHEHSIEVQLPFIQYLKKNEFKFVPIVVSQARIDTYKQLGKELAGAIKDSGEDILIIASSDMTHYEDHESAKTKDMLAIEAILKLDTALLMDTILKHNISMCGYAPIIVMLEAAKKMGAKKAELVDYKTSGEATGDYSSVVGYAGIIVK